MRATATPTNDWLIELTDGRRLAVAEWGDLGGRPVLLFHGRPGSRLFCPDEEATVAAGVRLITIDRPGYGRSDPQPGRTLLDWGDDCAQLAQRLGLDRFAVIGWSSGGPYAMACAVRLPKLVSSVGLAASEGPVEEIPAAWDELSVEGRELRRLLRRDPKAAAEAVARRAEGYRLDPGSIFAGVPEGDDPDAALMRDPAISEPMIAWMIEGARQGLAGYVSDWVAEYRPWGFALGQVAQPVNVWWGSQDHLTPAVHAESLAALLPAARLTLYPNDGHNAPIVRWAEMLAALV